jgi:DNA-directed RNA polymerase subunit F
MILERNQLNLNEVEEILDNIQDSEKKEEMKLYLKKFLKIKSEKAKKMKEELQNSGILKLNENQIAKIIDLLPEDAAGLNKIFTDVSLNEDETNKILGIVKNDK